MRPALRLRCRSKPRRFAYPRPPNTPTPRYANTFLPMRSASFCRCLKFYLANPRVASYLASPVDMSWKRAQIHAESMLENLVIGEKLKGRKELRGKKVIFVDDGSNAYRTMCFTIGAKLAKKRGAEIEMVAPGPGEVPHAKVIEVAAPPKPKVQRPINRR